VTVTIRGVGPDVMLRQRFSSGSTEISKPKIETFMPSSLKVIRDNTKEKPNPPGKRLNHYVTIRELD